MLVANAFACLAPTQITLHVMTDVDCAVVAKNGTAIYSGDPNVEPVVTSTSACTVQPALNDIGTLVLAPSGSRDDRITVAVVMAVEGEGRSEDCAGRGYQGCVLAKRRVRYVPHEPLQMPVEMSLQCKGVVCDPDETCFRGACIDAEFAPSGGCVGPECTAPPMTTANPANDAGLDAPLADGAADAAVTVTQLWAGDALGLAVSGSLLYWTIEGEAAPNRASINAPLGPLSPEVVPAFPSAPYRGIAADSRYVVAARAGPGGGCAFRGYADGAAGDPILCQSPFPGFGVAILDDLLYVTRNQGGAQAEVRFVADGGWTRTLPFGGEHIEADIAGAYWVSGGRLRRDQDGAVDDLGPLPSGASTRGIALRSRRGSLSYVVSSTDGRIDLLLRASVSTPAVLLPAQAPFTAIEDLAHDPVRDTLFVSGAVGANRGIFAVEGYQSRIP